MQFHSSTFLIIMIYCRLGPVYQFKVFSKSVNSLQIIHNHSNDIYYFLKNTFQNYHYQSFFLQLLFLFCKLSIVINNANKSNGSQQLVVENQGVGHVCQLRFKFLAIFPIGLHVILQITDKKKFKLPDIIWANLFYARIRLSLISS